MLHEEEAALAGAAEVTDVPKAIETSHLIPSRAPQVQRPTLEQLERAVAEASICKAVERKRLRAARSKAEALYPKWDRCQDRDLQPCDYGECEPSCVAYKEALEDTVLANRCFNAAAKGLDDAQAELREVQS